tara:strand:- start:57 stop:932 length:876 start_codon:yes stop_codon:yes gene_type:complete
MEPREPVAGPKPPIAHQQENHELAEDKDLEGKVEPKADPDQSDRYDGFLKELEELTESLDSNSSPESYQRASTLVGDRATELEQMLKEKGLLTRDRKKYFGSSGPFASIKSSLDLATTGVFQGFSQVKADTVRTDILIATGQAAKSVMMSAFKLLQGFYGLYKLEKERNTQIEKVEDQYYEQEYQKSMREADAQAAKEAQKIEQELAELNSTLEQSHDPKEHEGKNGTENDHPPKPLQDPPAAHQPASNEARKNAGADVGAVINDAQKGGGAPKAGQDPLRDNEKEGGRGV